MVVSIQMEVRGWKGAQELWRTGRERGQGASGISRVYWSPKAKGKVVLALKRPCSVFTKA